MKPKEEIKILKQLETNETKETKKRKEIEKEYKIIVKQFEKEQIKMKQDKIYIRYKKNEEQKLLMKNKILALKNDIWCPDINTEIKHLNTNSCFGIQESETYNVEFKKNEYNIIKKEEIEFKTIKVVLKFSEEQKKIINLWLNTYREMYNLALKYIKDNVKKDKNVLNFFYTRSKLKKVKSELLVKNISNEKQRHIVNDIDNAIKLACQNYSTGFKLLNNRKIKHFRIRYWKKNKPLQIMCFTKPSFKSGSIKKNILGKVNGFYNGYEYNFKNINTDCKLQKNYRDYFLFVPVKIKDDNDKTKDDKTKNNDKKIKQNNKKEQISIDLGIRTFGTCITENSIVKLGDKFEKTIKFYLERKDKILNNIDIDKKIKKKNEKRINKKIRNLTDELHWKTINYLTSNYKTIIIGDLKSQGIVKRDGNLGKMTKRISMSFRFFEFKQRLTYKCHVTNTNLCITNEWMTSKMCSLCGTENKKLGASKIFNCENCLSVLDRDINGARNIHLKSCK